MLTRKAADESRKNAEGRLGRLAGELESAVEEMVGFSGEAGFQVQAPAGG